MKRIPSPSVPARANRDVPFHAQIEPRESVVLTVERGVEIPTGPLEVVGSQPGDAIAVTIQEIAIRPDAEGIIRAQPGVGLFGERFADMATEVCERRVAIGDGLVEFDKRLRIPVRPSLSLIETFPTGEALPTHIARSYWPWRYGGDLGCLQVAAGSRVFLPVAVAGAGLMVGGVCAALGDGVLLTTGCQVAGEVTLTIDVLPGRRLRWPFLETEQEVMAIASARTMAEATVLALEQMAELLQHRLGLSFEEAGMVLSLAGDVRFCQALNAYVTVRAALPKTVVPGLYV